MFGTGDCSGDLIKADDNPVNGEALELGPFFKESTSWPWTFNWASRTLVALRFI